MEYFWINVESFTLISPSPLTSADFIWISLNDALPVTTFTINDASLTSIVLSKLTSPYRYVTDGLVVVGLVGLTGLYSVQLLLAENSIDAPFRESPGSISAG